jgi:hypothetical protein
MNSGIEGVLGTDGPDPGCDGAFEELDRYVEALHAGEDAAARFPSFATHIRNCIACREDTEALLAAMRAMQPPPD